MSAIVTAMIGARVKSKNGAVEGRVVSAYQNHQFMGLMFTVLRADGTLGHVHEQDVKDVELSPPFEVVAAADIAPGAVLKLPDDFAGALAKAFASLPAPVVNVPAIQIPAPVVIQQNGRQASPPEANQGGGQRKGPKDKDAAKDAGKEPDPFEEGKSGPAPAQ